MMGWAMKDSAIAARHRVNASTSVRAASCWFAIAALVTSVAIPDSAAAQGAPDIVNPEVLRPRAPATQLGTLLSLGPQVAVPPSEQRDIVYDLNVTYTESQLWNPTVGRPDKVKLRSIRAPA
jgi:hypothetical protein